MGRFFLSLFIGLSLSGISYGKQIQGTFYQRLDADPTTLNPVTSTDYYANVVQGYVFNTLMTRHLDTYEWTPSLAESYKISKDGKSFTFKLREGVKWHDGKPLTAEDVKYSFDIYFEGRFQHPQMMVFLENFKEVKVIDPRTVEFVTKSVYFKNFDVAAGGFFIIPKHFYSVGDPKDPKFNKELIGTGPYKLVEWSKGQKIILKRNPDFWGDSVPYYADKNNFDRIFFRPVKENAVALELLKKGDLDYREPITAEEYVNAKGPEWGTKVVAVKTENSASANFDYGFIGWNNKHPFFQDKRVRQAMSYLINRDLMIEKFRYGMSDKTNGPFGNKSTASSPKVKAIGFDQKKALTLLQQAGWKLGDKGLTKTIDGKETVFEFTIVSPSPDFEKYLTMMKEDMKKVGVIMNIKNSEWNSFLKLIDERKFDAVVLSWSVTSLEPDPKELWHSESANSTGNNFVGYMNPEVDKLIDKLRTLMSAKARIPLYHKIHEIIAEDQPYSFLFSRKFALYANSTKITKPKDTFKYDIGTETWLKKTAD